MVAPQHRNRGALGGLKHRQVVRLLAAEEITRSEIARRYEVTPGAVTQFADRNAEEIAAVKADMDNEFAGILIANKAMRLGVYEQLLEAATTPMPVHDARTGKVMTGPNGEPIMEADGNLAAKVLKQAAEEMGQLPTRLQVAGGLDVTTTYRIEGVNPEDLR